MLILPQDNRNDIIFIGDLVNFVEASFIKNVMHLRLNFIVNVNEETIFNKTGIPFLKMDDPKFIGFFLLDEKNNFSMKLNDIYKVKKNDYIEMISILSKDDQVVADAYREHIVLNKKPIIIQYIMLLNNDSRTQ